MARIAAGDNDSCDKQIECQLNAVVDNIAIEQEVVSLGEKLFPADNYQVDFQLQPFSQEPLGFQGVYKLLTVEARDRTNANLVITKRFFVKTTVPNCNDHQRNIFNREPRFFATVVPHLLETRDSEPWAPKCYLAKDGVLIFEDLKSQGFEVVRREYDEARLKSLFSCLARFHAASMLLQDSTQKSIDNMYPGVFPENMFYNDGQSTWNWLTTGIEVMETIAGRLNFDPKRIPEAYLLALKTIAPVDTEINVICHSDLWRNNVLFGEDGKSCRLVDFQLAAYKCYAVDLAQALYLNATKANRLVLEKGLVQLYHEQLSECWSRHGCRKKPMSLEEVFEAVEKKRICGLVSAVQILPIALLNEHFSTELIRDTESLTTHMYVSRKNLILRAMRSDADFGNRIEEVTMDLMEYMDNILS